MTNIAPRRDHSIVDSFGKMTRRFAEYLENLGREVNGIAGSEPPETPNAMLFDLQGQIGSGDPLTWDETGFTWDSTKLSFDQTEA